MKLEFGKQINYMSIVSNEVDDSVKTSFVIAFNIA